MRADGVEAMVIVGGDGSFRGALSLQDECDVPVAGITGTIDNDVYGTDETIGFDTAVNTAVLAIDELRDTSESTGMMFFVEVMGGTSGAIALHTAVAGGAAGVLVPEAHEQISGLAEQLRGSFARGKRSHIIVVAEGDEACGAFAVGYQVGRALDHPYRVIVLGHIQRGGRPTMLDRIVASEAGALAVEHQSRFAPAPRSVARAVSPSRSRSPTSFPVSTRLRISRSSRSPKSSQADPKGRASSYASRQTLGGIS